MPPYGFCKTLPYTKQEFRLAKSINRHSFHTSISLHQLASTPFYQKLSVMKRRYWYSQPKEGDHHVRGWIKSHGAELHTLNGRVWASPSTKRALVHQWKPQHLKDCVAKTVLVDVSCSTSCRLIPLRQSPFPDILSGGKFFSVGLDF